MAETGDRMDRIRGLAGIAAALAAGLAAHSASAQPPFSIIVIPDTQYYSQSTLGPGDNFFDRQMQWIVDSLPPGSPAAAGGGATNILFATHLGDVVNIAGPVGSPRLDQWDDAVRAMNILRSSPLPHSVLPGNHDWTDSAGIGSLEHYRIRFGDTSGYFDGRPWFLGFDPRGGSSAQRFATPAGDFLHIALEWNASVITPSSDRPAEMTSPLTWAAGIIAANPGLPTIISTHNHINGSSLRDGAANRLFDEFVRRHSQVFMVLNGHYSGEGRVYSFNDAGRAVYELNTDYQSRNRGGDGWLRIMTFEPENARIRFRTFTPIADAVDGVPAGSEFGGIGRIETDADSLFDLPLDFAARFAPAPAPDAPPMAPPRATFVLKRGVNGYTGTVDTEVRSAAPTTTFATQGYMHIDTNDGTPEGPSCGLVRFDGLFGVGARQIAEGDDIIAATLRLHVHAQRSSSQGAGLDVRRLLVPFSDASTWNSFQIPQTVGGGAIAGFGERGSSGFGALAGPDGEAGYDRIKVPVITSGQYLDFNVTRALRAFNNGQPNHGWLIQAKPACTDAVRLETTDSTLTGATFPELVISKTLSPGQVRTFTQGLDTQLDQSRPTTSFGSSGTFSVDASVEDNDNAALSDVQSLIRFTGLFGDGPAQVPAGAWITSAVLKLHVNANVQYHAGGGFTVHRVLRPWTTGDTWNSLGGGIDRDQTDAAAMPDDFAGQDVLNDALVQAGVHMLDVTDSVRRWAEATGGGEAANLGWALLPMPNATNAIIFDSFQTTAPGGRPPELVVRFLCPADYNGQGGITVQDIFDFLAAYFASAPRADINRDGVRSVQDIFDFLARYFGGC